MVDERLNSGDKQLRYLELNVVTHCLGPNTQWIVNACHAITRVEWDVLAEVVGTFGGKAGIWGELAAVGEPGRSLFYSPLSGEVPFAIWGNAENQRYLRRILGSLGRHTFAMAIDTTVDIAVTEAMWSADERNLTDVDGLLGRLPLIIDRLRWAYVPLTNVVPMALIIVANNHAEQYECVVQWLRLSQRPCARLEARADGGIVWQELGTQVSLLETFSQPE